MTNNVIASERSNLNAEKCTILSDSISEFNFEFIQKLLKSNDINTKTRFDLSKILDSKINSDIKTREKRNKFLSERTIKDIELIINVSELYTNSYQPDFNNYDILNDIIEPMYLEYKLMAERKNIGFKLINLNNKTIKVDLFSVRQIFNNLIDNAVKYTNRGEIVIEELDSEDENYLCIEIRDTGIGIDEEYLKKIFEPFSQEEEGYTRIHEGNGLGMLLVHKYSELNKINHIIESKKSIGTKVKLWIKKA